MAVLMLLGGSNGQLSAARRIKAMGHQVILADYYKDPPAAAVCDAHAQVSTFDAEACIQAAKEYGVNGVLTLGTDQPVYTAALVAKALGLPSPILVETAVKATNKRAMKEAFLRCGVPCVPFAFLREGQGPEALSALTAPLVVKPLDSQGQRGVFKVSTPEEAVSRLPETLSFSREREALAESFYLSDEVTLSCFVWEGQVYPLTLTDRQLMNDPVHIGVCAAHRYPSVHTGREKEISKIASLVARALGVRAGPLYIQLLVGKDGILVNEAACRIGGAFEDAFIPYVTGFDILNAAIRLALGEAPDLSALDHLSPESGSTQISVQMLFCRPGQIASMTPLEQVLKMPGMLTAGYNFGVGSTLPVLQNATARFGHCVLATRQGDMAEKVKALYRFLRVTDPTGNNLVISRTYDGKEETDA